MNIAYNVSKTVLSETRIKKESNLVTDDRKYREAGVIKYEIKSQDMCFSEQKLSSLIINYFS